MSDPTAGRPRQVTLAGWLLMAGSALAVLLVADRLAGLHSLESRQAVEQFLSREPGSGLGLDVDGALSLIRTAAMVTAGCATAAGILGYQVLRRSRSARLAVSVLAVPIFLTGMVTGGFVTSVIAASAAILWLQPARAWFDGTTPPPPRERPAPAAVAPTTVAPPVPTPYGRPAWQEGTAPAPAGRRPGAVVWACVLTWAATGLSLLGVAASGVVLAVRTDMMLEEAHRQSPDLADQGVTDEMLVVATYALIGGIALWCVAAAVVAWFVLRGAAWARVALLISAAAASAACLLGAAMGAVVLLLPLGASIAAIALLLRSEVGLFFSAPRR